MKFLLLFLTLFLTGTVNNPTGNVPLHEKTETRTPDYSKEKGYFDNVRTEPVVTWVFEEGTFVPAAKLTEKQQYSIATNYLGTPEAMYREDGETVWTCELNSYGKVRNFQGQSKTDCPFRYQGQYEDAETGLYYNRFRYYSPEEGMYLSQDPISINGNLNLYAYVSDTNIWDDIFGLNKNSDNEIGHFGIYQIKIDGETYKYGKADLGRVTIAGFDGKSQPTKLHQQVRKLREQNPSKRVTGEVIKDLGVTTTKQAKKVETDTIQSHYDATHVVPEGNRKSFEPSCGG
jgi:RHS repeat-associated protein